MKTQLLTTTRKLIIPSRELLGKKTLPSQSIDDPGFKYVSAVNTNLTDTFRKAKYNRGPIEIIHHGQA